MPIYEYACEKCGSTVEVMQKVSDPAPSRCERCGAKKLAKVLSLTTFQLKGGGWYKDLYGSSGSSKKNGGSKAQGSSTAPASSPSTPAPPSTPTPTKT